MAEGQGGIKEREEENESTTRKEISVVAQYNAPRPDPQHPLSARSITPPAIQWLDSLLPPLQSHDPRLPTTPLPHSKPLMDPRRPSPAQATDALRSRNTHALFLFAS
ncbi:hypothetical protein E2C01_004411 [Portunus trituberculatus]|uniref:Uncharacterized protein n=1 Tax=Portunus trituberculatus TaxID=210409 RepID=A0A5B7CPS5_PORTR|nr:hypothetical protein [Portunus trituberculatus]